MRAIICENIEEFNSLNDRIDQGLASDIADYSADKWTDPIVHPQDYRIAIVIEARVEEYLTEEELDRAVELPEDWFPVVEE